MTDINPFAGLNPYRIEDAGFFLGRDAEADLLTSRILSSRFTLLHARSGAGKSSLLNARVLWQLESRGWTTVIARPEDNPSMAVCAALLNSLFPPPLQETEVIARLLESRDPARTTLPALVAAFKETEGGDDARRDLLRPVPLGGETTDRTRREHVYTQFHRLLRGGMSEDEYLAHVAAIAGRPPGEAPLDVPTVADLNTVLIDAAAGSHAELRMQLQPRSGGLVAFLENLFAVYGRWRPELNLVIILDQFEELFTLYGDPAVSRGSRHYSLRNAFFDELFELFRRVRDAHDALPVRVVISIRQEFIAELDPIRRFVIDLDQQSFHLDRLAPEAARRILGISGRTSRAFPDDLKSEIVDGLTREGGYVESTELQIVSKAVWESPLEPSDAYRRAGEWKGILDAFFIDVLDGIEKAKGPVGRVEAVEMLGQLVTAGAKNPRPKRELATAPFRDSSLRQDLLQRLEDAHVIRVEFKNGAEVVEVRHDFLVGRIHDVAAHELDQNMQHALFRSALAVLRFAAGFPQLLTADQFALLSRYVNRIDWSRSDVDGEPLKWSPAEVMLRSAIANAHELPDATSHLREWHERLGIKQDTFTAESIPAAWAGTPELDYRRILTMNANRDSWRNLGTDQLLHVVCSHIVLCGEDTRSAIVYWTHQWMDSMATHQP